MDRKELLELRSDLQSMWVVRKKLGAFDANAEVILLLLENNLRVLDHIISKEPRPAE